MLYVTLTLNQFFLKMVVAYRIPSQENLAKECLTLRLKLEHFPTLQ